MASEPDADGGWPRKLGERIVVWGSGGKTTVSRRIGVLTGLLVVELDALYWQPRWKETAWEEFRRKVAEALAAHPEGWIVDGLYSRAQDLVLPQADTIVWLRLPFAIVFWRVVKRTALHLVRRDVLWGTNRETWRSFLSRDGMIVGTILWRIRGLPDARIRWLLANVATGAALIELSSTREVEEFLRSLESTRLQEAQA